MASAITFELDKTSLRGLDRALRTYQKATKKDMPDVVNRAAMNVAFRAAQFTPQANKESIRKLIGVRNPYALTVWDLKRRGKRIPKRDKLEAAVNRFIAAKLRTVAFIRAGWIPAAKKLQKVVKGGRPKISLSKIRRLPGKGDAVIARETLNTFSEVINKSTSKSPTSASALFRYGQDGLNKAVSFVTKDMLDYATERLRKNAKTFNRR